MEERRVLAGYCVQTRPKGEQGALGLILTSEGLSWILAPRGNKVGGKAAILGALTGSLTEFECARKDAAAVWLMREVKIREPLSLSVDDLSLAAFFLYSGELLARLFATGECLAFQPYKMAVSLLKTAGFLPAATLFVTSLVKLLGIQPNIGACVNCETGKNLVAFSYDEGGFLCQKCAQGQQVPPYPRLHLLAYRYLYTQELAQLEVEKIASKVLKSILINTTNYLETYFNTGFESKNIFFPLLAI